MSKKLGLYRCNTCGNIVQVLIDGFGELVCCGHEMELLSANKADSGSEKHIPVIIRQDDGKSLVKIGEIPHPMSKEHYIMFVETMSADKNKIYLEFLHPDMNPEIVTEVNCDRAFEYCNIHGLWEGEI